MRKIFLCGHTGSNNHGCEAIVKGTATMLKKQGVDCVLATKEKEQDEKYDISDFVDVITYKKVTEKQRKISRIVNKLTAPSQCSEYFHQKSVWKHLHKNVAVNVGGDTYCYDMPYSSIYLNRFTSKKNIPCILLGCSIEKDSITDEIKSDLEKYDLIMPRETLTYQNLIDKGVDKNKLSMMVDPAFILKAQNFDLDQIFFAKPVVGINLSPLVENECKIKGLVIENYERMIQHILDTTDYNIYLVPHVYSKEDPQDLIPLSKLYQKFVSSKRIRLLDQEANCKQLKYIISKCSLFVCARTHASIAAYSSLVPTLVLGYSIKSKGIALDLFSKYENYVLSTQDLKTSDDLKNGFIWLYDHKDDIRQTLENIMPQYKQKAMDAAKVLSAFCME